jgi:nucleotide-binding universal stress UspA family protein
VWQVPEGAYLAGFAPADADRKAFEDAARRLLADAVSEAAGEALDVRIEQVLREDHAPASALVAEARDVDADLLVVGSRGLGGLREFLLGSVSHACCQHAHCPVLVVPQRQ